MTTREQYKLAWRYKRLMTLDRNHLMKLECLPNFRYPSELDLLQVNPVILGNCDKMIIYKIGGVIRRELRRQATPFWERMIDSGNVDLAKIDRVAKNLGIEAYNVHLTTRGYVKARKDAAWISHSI